MIRHDTEYFDPPAPVASVSVANPLTKTQIVDVTMLDDSGADVTLLPSAADVGVLGRDILNNLRLELNGPALVGTVTR